MKGLIIKDLIVLKGQAKIPLLIVAVYLCFTFFSNDDMTMYHSMGTMIFSVLVITALAFDERSGWDKYSLTMPVGRNAQVYTKYLLSFLFPFIFLLFNLVVKQFLFHGLTIDTAKSMVLVTCIGVFYIALVLPLAFLLGTEKSRLLMMLIIFVPAIAIFAYIKLASGTISSTAITSITTDFTNLFSKHFLFIPLVAIVMLLLSLLVSRGIYQRKEF